MLFENQKALNPEDLVKYAETLGLDMPKFKECLDSGKHTEEINKDMAEGQKAGVSGTPSYPWEGLHLLEMTLLWV